MWRAREKVKFRPAHHNPLISSPGRLSIFFVELFKLRIDVLREINHRRGLLLFQISVFEQRRRTVSAHHLLHPGPEATNRTVDGFVKRGKQVFRMEIFDPLLDGCAPKFRIFELFAGDWGFVLSNCT